MWSFDTQPIGWEKFLTTSPATLDRHRDPLIKQPHGLAYDAGSGRIA